MEALSIEEKWRQWLRARREERRSCGAVARVGFERMMVEGYSIYMVWRLALE